MTCTFYVIYFFILDKTITHYTLTTLDSLKAAKGLKICHLNIRSILNKIDQFRLHFESSDLDVITISETWLTKEISSSILQMHNYQIFRWDRAYCTGDNGLIKKGGGLLIYVRDGLNFNAVMDTSKNISTKNCELQRIELCSDVQKNIVIYNLYRPPSGSVKSFTECLTNICEDEQNIMAKEVVFLGDFNINYLSKKADDTKNLISWQTKMGLSQVIKSHTRVSQKSKSLIDLIITDIEHCAAAGVINLHISDHQPVYLIKKKARDLRSRESFKGRSYIHYTKELLSDALTNEIKRGFRETENPNECWDMMENFLVEFLDTNCPIKTFRSKEKTPAWISHDIITLSKDRDVAWAKAKLTNTNEDWALARRLRNWANNSVKAAKADYVANELTESRNNPKTFWRNIKSVLPDQASGQINIKNPINNESLPKDQQAQVINDFFASIGDKLAVGFDNEDQPIPDILGDGDRLELRHITQIETLKLIDCISVYKSSGLDNISGRVLKDFLTITSRELTILYNNILDSGTFPDKWKIATVTPIPKVTNATSPSDLRPISLLPVPGKLLEKYISINIEDYLETNNFFTDCQNGFRKGKSTSSAMAKYLDDVLDGLNESHTCIAAYLDVRKAFDTINHHRLLNKLRAAGIGDTLCSLLENYLSNRKQKTKLYGSLSNLESVSIGVPQGSTVGPLMFIIYINDLPGVLDYAKPLMYADDTVIYLSGLNNKEVRKNLQCDLNNVEKWCKVNKLSLNISKTKIMTFMSDHKRKMCPKFRFYMKGKVVDEVDSYKYLGTYIDNRLNGNVQYTKTLQLLGLKLRTFGRIRRFLNGAAALTVYKSMILPLLDYNDHFQVLWNVSKLSKLQKLQNWGLRIVYSDRVPRLTEEEMHSAANLTHLKYRRIHHLVNIMYHRSKSEKYLDNRDLPTRQFVKVKFKVINPNIKSAFKSPNYFGAQLWDMLPLDVQTAPTYSIFKYKVKIHITAGIYNNV